MSAYLYSDDSGWSGVSSSEDDSSSSTSVTVSDVDYFGDAPEWMKKFSLSMIQDSPQAPTSNSSADGLLSTISTLSLSDNASGKSKCASANDGYTSSQASSPDLDSTQNSSWLKGFERVKDGRGSTDSPLPLNDKRDSEDGHGRDVGTQTSPRQPLTNLSSPTNDNGIDRGSGDSGYRKDTRDATTQTSQSLNSSHVSVGEAKRTKKAFPKPRKYRKSQPREIDRVERRNRIRGNLDKIRRRERIRKNLGYLQAQKGKGEKGKEQNATNKSTMTPTTSKRVKKYEDAIFKDMDRIMSPPYREKSDITDNSKRRNQTETEAAEGSKKKIGNKWSNIQNKWNNMKSPIQTPSTFEQNQRASSFGNTYTYANHKLVREKEKAEGNKERVAGVVKSSPFSYQKDTIKVPSIKSKVSALRKKVEKNNRIEKISYAKSKKSAATQKKYMGQGKTRKAATVVKSSPNLNHRDAVKAPSIKSKVNALQNKMEKNKKYEQLSYPKNFKSASITKSPVSATRNQHTNSQSQQKKAAAPKVSNAKLDSATKNVPEKQIKNNLLPVNAEIENTVPENLFGRWGDTVKTKKPTAALNTYSDKMAKKRANRVKQKIENAKNDTANETILELQDDAAALFYATGSRNNAQESYDFEADCFPAEVSSEMDDTGRKKESDGDDSMDEDATALFYAVDPKSDVWSKEPHYGFASPLHAVGPSKNARKFGVTELESKKNEMLENETSVDIDESETNETMDDDIFASPLQRVGSTKTNDMHDEDKFEEEVWEEETVVEESEMNDTVDDCANGTSFASAAAAANDIETNDVNKAESNEDEWDEETIVDDSEKHEELDEDNTLDRSLV